MLNKLMEKLLASEHFKKFASFGLGTIAAIALSYVSVFILNKSLTKLDMGLYAYYSNWINLFVSNTVHFCLLCLFEVFKLI